jgi:hypothetical protein
VLTVQRSVNGAAFSSAAPAQSLVDYTALRVRRTGNNLIFSRRSADVWVDVLTRALPVPATAQRGGVFVATGVAQAIRIGFDYLLVVDPTQTNSVLGSLRLTELMYNPMAGGVEFVELRNTGTQSINLQGVHFEDGSPFTGFTFGSVSLAAGEFIVLTENVAAFQAKYGTGARIGGQWASGSLNNAGEAVVLVDSQGNAIHDFQYDDIAPWPLTPDGQGPSLEVIDVNGDYNNGLNWRASFEPEGSPGFEGSGLDSDSDGIPDSVEVLFGTNPDDGNSRAVATATMDSSGHVTLTWPSVAGRMYRVERTSDLANWAPVQIVTAVASTSYYIDTNTAGALRLCYRIVALP